MPYPSDLRYTKEHEWARLQPDGTSVVGITSFAQEELGDIVFVDLPPAGRRLDQFAKFGEIESVKTVSNLYLPLGGEVIAVNDKLKAQPELVNRDPYGEGWLIRVRVADPAQAQALMSAADYERFLGKGKG